MVSHAKRYDADDDKKQRRKNFDGIVVSLNPVFENVDAEKHERRRTNICENHTDGAAETCLAPVRDGHVEAKQTDGADGNGACDANDESFEEIEKHNNVCSYIQIHKISCGVCAQSGFSRRAHSRTAQAYGAYAP